ncbi:ribosome biogenesis protein Nop53/GLTSCR2 [Cunninghamella echinulata]|nr:ribosome biogenesis protein Nop53/GLTSCR2 [Cunninghamella echinulata]
MSTGSAQVKKAQPSRKGKKAWRKNVDIAQLETGLEVLRSEERVRGTMDELPDEEYFTIDVTGDTHVKKQLKAKRQLRVDQILNEKSAVPALKGRHIQQISEPVYGTESKHQRQKINKLAKRKLKESPQPSPKKAKNKQAYDVWAVEGNSNEAEQNDYLTPAKQIKVKAPSTMKKIPKAAKHHPAVAIPHAGASYNPTEEDHAKLVKEATDIEVAKQEAKKRLDEIVSYIKELDNLKHEVDNNNGDNEEDDEDEDENDENEPITKKPANRKTTAQRNKEKRKRQELAVWRKRQTEKKLKQQIDKVEELEKELAAKQQEINTMTAIRQERKEQKEKEGSKRLSKHSMGEMDLEVQLEDELAESLRQLKVFFLKKIY